MSSPETIRPVNPLPPVVVALFGLIMAVEVMIQLGARGIIGGPGAVGWRVSAIQNYGINSNIVTWMLENGRYPKEYLHRFLSYAFVHGNFTHALFAGAMLLALGKFVGEVFSQWATALLFLASALGGAVIYGLFSDQPLMLVGAFPGVYGLIGGFTFLMWLKLGQMGAQQAQAFSLIGVLLALQLVFGMLFGGNGEWLADVGGFVCGFALSFVLSPGGRARIIAKIRQR